MLTINCLWYKLLQTVSVQLNEGANTLENKLKQTLKFFKLNESTISTVLGAIIIVVVVLLGVRYFKNLDITTGKITDTSATTQQEETAEGIYTVKAGDSLWSIAQNQLGDGHKWVEIAQENSITNPGMIEVGQKLKITSTIEAVKTVDERETTEQKIDTSTPNSILGATYTVEHGDTLWTIAVRAYGDGYKWVEIARENNLTNPNVIHSGNILTLPR